MAVHIQWQWHPARSTRPRHSTPLVGHPETNSPKNEAPEKWKLDKGLFAMNRTGAIALSTLRHGDGRASAPAYRAQISLPVISSPWSILVQPVQWDRSGLLSSSSCMAKICAPHFPDYYYTGGGGLGNGTEYYGRGTERKPRRCG